MCMQCLIMSSCGETYCLVSALILLFIVYKLFDRLLRLPTVRVVDRYVLITGCSSGFGHDLARRLDSRGCHVFAGVRNEKAETELKKICSSRLITVMLDVAKPDSVRKAFQLVSQHLEKRGDGRLSTFSTSADIIRWLRHCTGRQSRPILVSKVSQRELRERSTALKQV